MLDERFDQVGSVPQASFDVLDVLMELGKRVACHVSQVNDFHITPDPFGRVQFGSIARKWLKMNTLSSSIGATGLRRLGTVCRSSVREDHWQAREAIRLVTEKEINDLLKSVDIKRAATRDIQTLCFVVEPNGRQLVELAKAIEDGKIRQAVDEIFSFAKAC
jgi:hypothetical protein